MKKKLLTIVAVLLVAVMSVALVACKDTAKVEKEQWEAAFGVENFLSDFQLKVTQTSGDETYNILLTVGSGKCGSLYLAQEEIVKGVKEFGYYNYRIVDGENDVYYSKDGEIEDGEFKESEWIKNSREHTAYEAEENYAQWVGMLKTAGYEYLLALSDKFESFTYASKEYSYEGEGIVLGERDYSWYNTKLVATSIKIKFANGKISSVTFNAKDTTSSKDSAGNVTDTKETEIAFTYEITYGAQTITAPTVE